MINEPADIMLEVEGVLEDVLAEVFRKRVCPMLEYCPGREVRIVVTTQPGRFRGGLDGGDNFFTPGEPGRMPEFTWKSAGVFQSVIHQFRFEFLGNLDARALESYVLFGIYREAARPAIAGPRRPEGARPGTGAEAVSFSSVAIVPVEPASPPKPHQPLRVVANGGVERLEALGAPLPASAEATPRPERIAQVIEAAAPQPPVLEEPVIEEVPEDVYQPLPEAEIASLVPGLEEAEAGVAGPREVEPAREAEQTTSNVNNENEHAGNDDERAVNKAAEVFVGDAEPEPEPDMERRSEVEFAPRFRYRDPFEHDRERVEEENYGRPRDNGHADPEEEAPVRTAGAGEVAGGEDERGAAREAAWREYESPGMAEPAAEEAAGGPRLDELEEEPEYERADERAWGREAAQTRDAENGMGDEITPAGGTPELAIAPEAGTPELEMPGEAERDLPGNFYQEFFGFECMPFNNTPDTQFFMTTRRQQEALARLMYAISERKGFVLITGEIGCGKSTLCREVVARLPREIRVALISHTHLSATQLLRAIAEDLGLEAYGLSRYDLLRLLNEYLIEQMASGSTVCIIIDEAQNLDPDTLEEVRMISNLETEQEKLVQIVLVGQPEMRKKLALPELRQLRQRIAVQYHLEPLTKAETRQYICHRLKVAGPRERLDFKRGAMDEVHRFTGGVPRLINTLCDFGLLTAFTRGRRKITGGIIREAARDLGIEARYGRITRWFQFW